MRRHRSPFKQTHQVPVCAHGLYTNGHAGLGAAMAQPRKERTASKAFQDVWDPLDRMRDAKKISVKRLADKSGFKRAAYFVYANRGTIPFHMLEAMARYLGASFQATVRFGRTKSSEKLDGHATSAVAHAEEKMVDSLEPILQLLRDLPEDQRAWAAGAIYPAVKEALANLPFAKPAAGHKKASRGRRSKRGSGHATAPT